MITFCFDIGENLAAAACIFPVIAGIGSIFAMFAYYLYKNTKDQFR
jgi:hypothetical protein